jgi:hypothetical protein
MQGEKGEQGDPDKAGQQGIQGPAVGATCNTNRDLEAIEQCAYSTNTIILLVLMPWLIARQGQVYSHPQSYVSLNPACSLCVPCIGPIAS